MSFPNQKKVKIAERTERDKDHLYATMNIDALSAAVRDLNGSALKMWLYFNKNQKNYMFELSQKACDDWGIKKDSYYNGIKELEAKGYLYPLHEGSNIFCFYETARAENPNQLSEKPIWFSETQNNLSENPERNNTNNTNNTKIKQYMTMESSNAEESFKDNSFAVGERDDCGDAAIVSNDDCVNKILKRFPKAKVYDSVNLLDKYY